MKDEHKENLEIVLWVVGVFFVIFLSFLTLAYPFFLSSTAVDDLFKWLGLATGIGLMDRSEYHPFSFAFLYSIRFMLAVGPILGIGFLIIKLFRGLRATNEKVEIQTKRLNQKIVDDYLRGIESLHEQELTNAEKRKIVRRFVSDLNPPLTEEWIEEYSRSRNLYDD